MSPFGSRIFEFTRAVALRLIPQPIRKRIKDGLVGLRQLPLRLSGVGSAIDAQKSELRRMKSKITLLQGKLNAALYGLPQLGRYRAASISNNILAPTDLSETAARAIAEIENEIANHLCAPAFELSRSKIIEGFSAAHFLAAGIRHPENLRVITQAFAGVREIRGSDPDEAFVLKAKEMIPSGDFFTTDPLATLMSSSKKYDLVFLGRWMQASPREQIQVIDLAIGQLNRGGMLTLAIPNPANPESYWMDPENLRPISITLLEKLLGAYGGRVEVFGKSGPALLVAFRKS